MKVQVGREKEKLKSLSKTKEGKRSSTFFCLDGARSICFVHFTQSSDFRLYQRQQQTKNKII